MKNRRGVTLMELIVALTITGFMAALGTATFTSIIDNRHIIRESTAPTERAAALRETIRQWLLPATIQVQAAGAPSGRNQSSVRTTINNRVSSNGADGVAAAASSGDDELVFNTTAPNPTNAPNARMRLFVDTDEETPETGLTLEYQVNQQSPLQRRQLDSTITGMTVEYLNRQNNQWVTADNSVGIRAKAVRLTLIAADGIVVPPLMALPMTFGIAAAVVNSPTNPGR
ncbi:MAG: prepilin-type N-terminal cleavage/methylation domain-containing protein [Gemmatimonadaceae bacterium]